MRVADSCADGSGVVSSGLAVAGPQFAVLQLEDELVPRTRWGEDRGVERRAVLAMAVLFAQCAIRTLRRSPVHELGTGAGRLPRHRLLILLRLPVVHCPACAALRALLYIAVWDGFLR
jgi:hypothetical protein